ncbi:SPOR domain-containing protein [Novosphingobium sp. RD2P27]|uniref:SPOR domain-containing protein n=1 Tax=Novosphingobium kalidii TaxID=3230299 RepID=A0ABV2D2L4_9SPHN
MQAKFNKSARVRLALRTAFAVAVASGSIAAPGFAEAKSRSRAERDEDQAHKKLEVQLAATEQEVFEAPQDTDKRARLAQSYLSAGRFVSAATTFEDAVALGDTAPSTALGMVLAYIGSGRNTEAVALLGQWRESLPPGDFALALALAGQPGEAVTLLGESIRKGENTPKIRQNLAYAYALAGHLREARIVASQDVPADQLDVRVSEWALQASVGSQQSRVAALLGAPLRGDPGQPVQLALGEAAEPVSLAAQELATDQELPPMPRYAEAPVMEPQSAFADSASGHEAVVERAVEAVKPQTTLLAQASPISADHDPQFVSNPVVQSVAPARLARADVPVAASPAPRKAAKAKVAEATVGDYAVQLGSFASEEGARRAWNLFVRKDPSLKDRTLRITEAMVKGRRYWRVAAAGFGEGEARAKCSTVRGQGRGCLAYGEDRSLPGAAPVQSAAERLATR